MRHFRIILGLLLVIIACTFFSSHTAHAATSPITSQPHWKLVATLVKSSSIPSISKQQARSYTLLQPNATSGCVIASESDNKWGFTYNAYGEQLNLNSVWFGAENNCTVDAVNGTWAVAANGTCGTGSTGGGLRTIASGRLGFLAAQNGEGLFIATIVYRCLEYNSAGTILTITPPSAAYATFVVRANLSGGTNSSYSYTVGY